jgi:hypothetical protein
MKKVLSTLLVAGMFAFYACGPSAEEKAATEKATQDSIAAAEASAKAAMEMDSMQKAAMPADTTMKMEEKK